VAGKDGDLFDELFDQSLIKLYDVGFLLGDEVLQLLDPVLTGYFCVGDFQVTDAAPDDGLAASGRAGKVRHRKRSGQSCDCRRRCASCRTGWCESRAFGQSLQIKYESSILESRL